MLNKKPIENSLPRAIQTVEVTFLCFLLHVNVTEESSFEQCSDSLCKTGSQGRNTFSMLHDSPTESNLRGFHSQRVPVGSPVKLSGRSSPHRKACRWTNHAFQHMVGCVLPAGTHEVHASFSTTKRDTCAFWTFSKRSDKPQTCKDGAENGED